MKLVTCAGVVLLAAALLGEIARRLRVPSVLGYLGAGVLLGPSGLAADPTRLPALLRHYASNAEINPRYCDPEIVSQLDLLYSVVNDVRN